MKRLPRCPRWGLVGWLIVLMVAPLQAEPGLAPRSLPLPVEQQLRDLLADPILRQAHAGLAIVALGSAENVDSFPARPYTDKVQPLLLGVDQDKRFLPASNLKLFTAAMVLRQLGPQHTFATHLYQMPTSGGWGLRLIGGGDPSLTSSDVQTMAEKVAASGIHHVVTLQYSGGGLTAESFGGRYPDGWTLDDSIWYYGPEIGGLAIDRNQVDVVVTGAARSGLPAHVELQPQLPGFALGRQVLVQVTTGGRELAAANPDDLLQFDRRGGAAAPDGTVVVSGQVAPGQRVVTGVAVPHPGAVAALVLAQALRRRGIEVDKIEPAALATATPQQRQVARHDSPPLRFLLQRLLKNSDNLYAEMLLRDAVLAASNKAPANQAEAGRDLILQWLRRNGVSIEGVQIRDGSGLSRYDLVTPNSVAQLLRAVNGMPDGIAIWESLPVAGRDGTLHGRMVGTAAAGNVRAKTGTFSIASTLSGYVTTADGHRLAVSLLTNFAADGDGARRIQDKVFTVLAAARIAP